MKSSIEKFFIRYGKTIKVSTSKQFRAEKGFCRTKIGIRRVLMRSAISTMQALTIIDGWTATAITIGRII